VVRVAGGRGESRGRGPPEPTDQIRAAGRPVRPGLGPWLLASGPPGAGRRRDADEPSQVQIHPLLDIAGRPVHALLHDAESIANTAVAADGSSPGLPALSNVMISYLRRSASGWMVRQCL